jgi:hypothetical protein
MGIVWLFLAIVVLAIAVPLIRAEIKLRRRAALELPPGLSGPARRRARRQTLADLRHRGRPLHRPASNTSDVGQPGAAVDGGGHGGGHG